MLTLIPFLEHSCMEHKAFLSACCRTFMHTREKDVFFLNVLRVSRTNSTRGTIPCDVCENSHVFRVSRCCQNNVCTRKLTHLFLTDDGVTFGENIVFVSGSFDHFSQCFTFFFKLFDHVIIENDGKEHGILLSALKITTINL